MLILSGRRLALVCNFGCGWRWLGHAILIANGLWTAILAFSGGGLLWHAILALAGAFGCYFGMQRWL